MSKPFEWRVGSGPGHPDLQTRNEAAERLLERLEAYTNPTFTNDVHADLNDALAVEYEVGWRAGWADSRRATVERIEAAYRRGRGYPPVGNPRTDGDDWVLAILDEEAAR